MKRLFSLTLVLMLGLFTSCEAANIAFTAYSPDIGVERGIWQVGNAEQVQRVVARNIDNPRACYYLINQAYRAGLEVQTAVAFKPYAEKQPFDPEMQAIYAYACLVGTMRALSSGNANVPQAVTQNNLFSEQSTSYLNLKLTMTRTPEEILKSPEAIVMTAACYEDEMFGFIVTDTKRWDQLKSWSEHATKLAPQWADAHFRYGSVLRSYSQVGDLHLPKATEAQALAKSKSEFILAQSLDTSLPMTGSCARSLAANAYSRAQYGEAIKYLDLWFKYLPEYSRVENLQEWRQEMIEALQKR